MKTYTVTVQDNGTKHWYLNDQLHREDGPAIEWSNGTKAWYLNGQQHREDGPAAEWADGTKKWFLNHQLHRTDGPAVEYASGDRTWWLNGKRLTEAQFNQQTQLNSCAGRVVEIDGIKYQLTPV